jgi:tRNA A37 threonylcarbamoyltransferase TsaD
MDQPFLGFISNTTNTEILVFNGKGYEILGMDIDIPLGKAFYDLSSLLSVDWNHINAEDYSTLIYPVPMTQHKGLDFSFAGSYFYTLQHIYPHRNLPARAELLDPCFLKSNILGMNILACSFLKAVTTQVQNRIAKAIKWGKIKYPTIKSFVCVI